MGAFMSIGPGVQLTQYDIEEVQQHCGDKISQKEVVYLYKRFRALDRNHKGYISTDEFLNIPEISLNPLAQRLVRVFENVNFKDFAYLLSSFCHGSSLEDNMRFLFMVYDVSGTGKVSKGDILHVLQQMAGGAVMNEAELLGIIEGAMEEAGVPEDGMTLQDFIKVFTDKGTSKG
eukprot:CAMPEP_0182868056 /NCGR_PEP_ID=MMETSP0034_2-20130328/9088_1 /TAXON_ID=156128 /ORGANISM="Nephroselmis pyriformis, Strain CCMP717" /LENGTH=174 /DNA_ID=CAMNT_0025000443 /DNA_START=191 /DNA_END=711 /DNA_ORIENTATION=+